MANDDYLGLTIINHSKHHSGGDDARQSSTNSVQNDVEPLMGPQQDGLATPAQTLEDTLLTVKEITERLLTLEKDFADYRVETTKKIEHLEKRVKADSRSLSERILEIQEGS